MSNRANRLSVSSPRLQSFSSIAGHELRGSPEQPRWVISPSFLLLASHYQVEVVRKRWDGSFRRRVTTVTGE